MEPTKLGFEPKGHDELGEALGMMDFETAAKMSGSRFVVLSGQLSRLDRALAAFMLDLQTVENGYVEHSPPLLVRGHALFGTGQLPKFEDDLYSTTRIQAKNLWNDGKLDFNEVAQDCVVAANDLSLIDPENGNVDIQINPKANICLLYTSPSPRDRG